MRECARRQQRLSGFPAADVCLSEVLTNCFPSAHRLTLVVSGAGERRQSPLQPPHTHTHTCTDGCGVGSSDEAGGWVGIRGRGRGGTKSKPFANLTFQAAFTPKEVVPPTHKFC